MVVGRRVVPGWRLRLDRARVDDRAARLHHRRRGLAEIENRVEVGPHRPVPFLGRDLLDAVDGRLVGGVVDQDVEPAELSTARSTKPGSAPPRRCRPGRARRSGPRPRPSAPSPGRRPPRSGTRSAHSLPRGRRRWRRAPDPRVAAGDDRGPAGQPAMALVTRLAMVGAGDIRSVSPCTSRCCFGWGGVGCSVAGSRLTVALHFRRLKIVTSGKPRLAGLAFRFFFFFFF